MAYLLRNMRYALTQRRALEPENQQLSSLIKRINKHMKRQQRIRKAREEASELQAGALSPLNFSNIRLFDQFLMGNRKIITLDCEWTMRRVMTEIGVTIHDHTGVVTHNICLAPGGHGFRHGKSRYMTDQQAKQWLDTVFADAEMIVGHALKNDRVQMKKWGYTLPNLPSADTASWSKHFFGGSNPCKLITLAQYFDIEDGGFHCAGNDSHITFKCAVAVRDAVLYREAIHDAK